MKGYEHVKWIRIGLDRVDKNNEHSGFMKGGRGSFLSGECLSAAEGRQEVENESCLQDWCA
jgi:hypothetical protein